ncbi:hypothetical protein K7432_009825, partial [Basidiobolus ranarum]
MRSAISSLHLFRDTELRQLESSSSLLFLDGQSRQHPTILNFFASPYFLLLIFLALLVNRINTLIPLHPPRALSFFSRICLRFPGIVILTHANLWLANLILSEYNFEMVKFFPLHNFDRFIQKESYTPEEALWWLFLAMGLVTLMRVFVSCIENQAPAYEQTMTLTEWGFMFYMHHKGDALIVAIIQGLSILTIEIIEIHPRGKKYRLIPTTIWGTIGLAHFIYAIWHRSFTYPNIQLLTRLPEALVIVIIAMFAFLHGLVYIFTGGEATSEILNSVDFPQLSEDYTLAVFRLGTACLDAVRRVGLRNELESIYVPRYTYLDSPTEPSKKSRASMGLGFGNEILDVIPIQNNRPNPVSVHSIYWGTLVKNFMSSLCQAGKVWLCLEMRKLVRFTGSAGINRFLSNATEENFSVNTRAKRTWNMKYYNTSSHQYLYAKFLKSVTPDAKELWEEDDDDEFIPTRDRGEQTVYDSEEEFESDSLGTISQLNHQTDKSSDSDVDEVVSDYISGDEDIHDNNETLNLISEIILDSDGESDSSTESTRAKLL